MQRLRLNYLLLWLSLALSLTACTTSEEDLVSQAKGLEGGGPALERTSI